ncbi:MAG: hypothetical protein AAF772_13195 [Acidobacteriota bacterium]
MDRQPGAASPQRRQDPIPWFGRALRHLIRAVRMAPRDAAGHALLLDLPLAYGHTLMDRFAPIAHVAGPRDPQPYFDSAIAHGWIALRLAQLRDRAVNAQVRLHIEQTLLRVAAQQRVFQVDHGATALPSTPAMLDPSIVPDHRAVLAYWLALAAALDGDVEAAQRWRAYLDIRYSKYQM